MPIDYTVPAIDRTVRLLEILSASPRGHSLAHLAEELDVPKSTLFRILHTLQEHAIVVEDPERKVFTLGMKLLEWGYTALSKIDLKGIAHQHLQTLAHKTRESFYLAILDGDEVILIDHVDTPEASLVDEIVRKHGLTRFTDRTITSMSKLRARIKQVRRDGYSIVDGEYKPDLCAIAVPIRDHTGVIMASLMTAIPSERHRKNKKLGSELLRVLNREAAIISKRLGFNAERGKP